MYTPVLKAFRDIAKHGITFNRVKPAENSAYGVASTPEEIARRAAHASVLKARQHVRSTLKPI